MEQKNSEKFTPERLCFLWTIVAGILIHLFRLVMPIHNYDDIHSLPSGYGAGAESGRWFLNIVGDWATKLFGGYNLPLVNGLVFIFFIAISASLLVSIFHITNRKHAVLIGLALVSFPVATATLFFMYTAPYYGMGVMLAVLAAWLLTKYKIPGLLGCAVCIALSLGIY